jgi:hypothetical protein
MDLSRRRTESHRFSITRPSFLGNHRQGSSDNSSVLQPLNRARTVPDKNGLYTCPQQTSIDPGHWRLPTRQRRLSISLPGFENDVEQLRKSDNQTLSLLFELPKDVRTRIYKFVIGSNVLHIVRRLDKLGHIACTTNEEPEVFGRDQCRGTKVEWGLQSDVEDGGLIQFLQTCRKM